MNVVDELERLQRLKNSGDLTEIEFEQAKRKLLYPESVPIVDQHAQQRIRQLERRQRILDLEQQWQSEREDYRVHGREGSYIPTVAGSLVGFIIVSFLACYIISMTLKSGSENAVWGILGLIAILIAMFFQLIKAFRYAEAEEEHEEQIARLVDEERHLNHH